MYEQYQIEFLINEIKKMIIQNYTFEQVQKYYKQQVPDYVVYNAYHAAYILAKDYKKHKKQCEDTTRTTKF